MQTIKKFCFFTINFIDRLNERIGKSIAWLALIMVITTFSIVVLRYVFDLGWIAMQESVFYMHGLLFTLGMAFTLKVNGHVRVDIIYQHASEKIRAAIDLFGTLLLLIPFCVYVFWSSVDYVLASWSINEGSREAGGLPGLFLIKSCIPVMAVLILLQGIAQFSKSLLVLLGHSSIQES